ncbi:MAG: hypothetical protein H6797_05945 [Candidatus Nomurabacteria bacterium]|nr:MAG: hypothetical protein H6797_05945 [Candidatus Nomurabacteria bacterium]
MALTTKGGIPDQDNGNHNPSEFDSSDTARGLSQLENHPDNPSDDDSEQGIQNAENFANSDSSNGNPFDSYYKKKMGGNKSGQHIDTHGDTVQDNPNADTPNLKEREENPGSLYKSGEESSVNPKSGGRWKSKFLSNAKRYGASGGAAGLVIGGFFGVSVIMVPGSLLVTIEKAITNDSSDSTRTNISFRRAYVSKLFNKGNSSTGSKIEDKLTSMSEGQKARFEKEGFKVELNTKGKIKSMKFPDGTLVKDGASFNSHAENTVEGRRATSNVLDVRSAFFENQKFKDVLKNFNIEKGKRLKPSEDADPAKRKKAIDESFDENTKLKAENTSDPKAVDSRVKDLESKTVESSSLKSKVTEITDKAGKAALAALPISTVCASYNVARLTTATIKAEWIYQLVSFAYPFVRAAAQIEDQGDIEPSVVENLANRLTWYDPNKTLPSPDPSLPGSKAGDPNPKYNLTAMDSQGLQMAIYGDFSGLTQFAKNYTSWGWEVSVNSIANKYINLVRSVAGSKQNVKDICLGAKLVNEAATIQCAAGPVAAALCVAGVLVLPTVGKIAAGALAAELAKPALAFLARVDLSSTTQGVDAGNALAAGIGLLLSNSTLGSGLRPVGGTSKAQMLQKIKGFIADTNETNYKYTTQLALDEAKRNQFDVSNQYSFMGQIASQLNPYLNGDGTFFSRIASMVRVIGTSFSKLPTSANALFSQPSNMTLEDGINGDPASNRINKCADQDMETIGAACDWSGRIIGYTTNNVLQGLNQIANNKIAGGSDILTKSINFMINDKTEYRDPTTGVSKTIDGDINQDTGETISHSNFENYIKYCVERKSPNNGTVPIGSSVESIAEDDGNWFDGERCLGKDNKDQTMLDSFATYYNWCYVQYATAERMTDCVHNTPEANNAANVSSDCGDGSTGSIYSCALQFDPYAYSYGAGHDEYGKVSWYQNFKTNTPSPNSNPFDCSSLVMASVVAAFGHDIPGMSAPSSFHDTTHWQKLPDGSAQQGDVIVWNGHVEIIKSKDGNGYTTFGAHTHHANNQEADISGGSYGLHGEGQGDAYDGVYRYVGPGASKSV